MNKRMLPFDSLQKGSTICRSSFHFLFSLNLLIAVGFSAFLAAGCRREKELTMSEALAQGRARELVKQYERRFEANPNYLGDMLNLSVMYTLSCRLDTKLAPHEKERRRAMAVQLVRTEFDRQLELSEPDIERLLHTGSVMAQIYATFGEENKMYEVFERLEKKVADDEDAISSISHGRDLLRKRLKEGYPLDTPNPFEGGKVLTRPAPKAEGVRPSGSRTGREEDRGNP